MGSSSSLRWQHNNKDSGTQHCSRKSRLTLWWKPIKDATRKASLMADHEYTSERVAAIAARGLDDPASLTLEEIRAVCGSALTQARPSLASLPPVFPENVPGTFAYYCRQYDTWPTPSVLESIIEDLARGPPRTLAELLKRG